MSKRKQMRKQMRKQSERRSPGRPPRGEATRVGFLVKFEPAFLDQLRRAAHATGWTVTEILEDGAAAVLRRLQRQFNNGQPFLPTPREGRNTA